MNALFLPTTLDEGKQYYNKYSEDFSQFDIVFITGDPYYDHPLSGVAILARLLDKKGYTVAIIPQPETDQDYTACGQPKFFFCITSGLLDSMLANYTPLLKQRENVLVPERALMVYTQKVKQLFKCCITVLGGVEATLRRFTHFDYRDNILRRGILNDTKAELLLFGNAERSILTLAERFKKYYAEQKEITSITSSTCQEPPAKAGGVLCYQESHQVVLDMLGNLCAPSTSSSVLIPYRRFPTFEKIRDALDLFSLEGAAFRIKKAELNKGTTTTTKLRTLPSYEECVNDKTQFNLLTRMLYLLPDDAYIEQCGVGYLQHNRPAHTLTEKEMDLVYELPFTRKLHPTTKNLAWNQEMVDMLKNSVVIGRGCWGSCSFCVIPLVQGKEVAKRSKESILKEIEQLYSEGEKKINDLTLPTLNMYGSRCSLYAAPQQIYSPIINEEITVYNKEKYCNQQCVGCTYRVLSDDLIPLLEGVEKLNKKYAGTELELRSALRHDIILEQKVLFRKVMQFITRLKIAPEHIVDSVLKTMNKANGEAFKEFLEEYKKINKEQGTHKNLVPYFIAAHPGTTMHDMEILHKFCKDNEIFVNLTQVFTPTPGTLSTAMYYSGEHPITGETVYIPRTFREKKDQKNILLCTTEQFETEDVDIQG